MLEDQDFTLSWTAIHYHLISVKTYHKDAKWHVNTVKLLKPHNNFWKKHIDGNFAMAGLTNDIAEVFPAELTLYISHDDWSSQEPA